MKSLVLSTLTWYKIFEIFEIFLIKMIIIIVFVMDLGNIFFGLVHGAEVLFWRNNHKSNCDLREKKKTKSLISHFKKKQAYIARQYKNPPSYNAADPFNILRTIYWKLTHTYFYDRTSPYVAVRMVNSVCFRSPWPFQTFYLFRVPENNENWKSYNDFKREKNVNFLKISGTIHVYIGFHTVNPHVWISDFTVWNPK